MPECDGYYDSFGDPMLLDKIEYILPDHVMQTEVVEPPTVNYPIIQPQPQPHAVEVKEKIPSKLATCPHCFRQFTNLRHHINQQHMQVKNFKCGECGYSCYLKTDLERHISNVHDKHRSPCQVCGKKYSDLRQHVRIVHEGAKAECPHCKGKYSNLSQHIHKVHLKTKNVMCDKCGMTFYHNSNLRKHLETTHATQTKAIQTLNNNYLPAPDQTRDYYNPQGVAPAGGIGVHHEYNYYAHYEHYNSTHHYHWYYQNEYYAPRQWW